MKHAMTLSLLVATVCAFGGAAAAQQGSGAAAPANQGTTGTSPNDMPSDSRTNTPGYGNDRYDTGRSGSSSNMNRSDKKQSLERIKKAIRDGASGSSQLSNQGGGSMSGGGRGAATGRSGSETADTGSTRGAVEHLKVFRRGDKVILRGTVHSQEDKDRVGSLANEAAPDENIVNELKVK